MARRLRFGGFFVGIAMLKLNSTKNLVFLFSQITHKYIHFVTFSFALTLKRVFVFNYLIAYLTACVSVKESTKSPASISD
jgi:hypothetical protein